MVATKIEENFPDARVWVPSKDDGIDLLVTNREHSKSISLQVKFSKDYLGNNVKPEIAQGIKSGGWWTFNREKIETSPADYWILVTYSFHSRDFDFIFIKPSELVDLYDSLGNRERINSYIWVTKSAQCWETRGLGKKEQISIANGTYNDPSRSLTSHLNNWSSIHAICPQGS
ncbi:hypothetical protein [Jeongeupia sp. HS-3]|uniref:hypothetical protein n=1 Tax=Jeongeupia sp. HS-3 TaxID=1009682 RepID=UPI0019109A23|nr:hypothetical protein [Jeongeupia sp. HS-3]